MSCPDSSCYDTTNPCGEGSPYYQDCGCLNPTTLQCVTKLGDYPNLGVTNDMNGLQALSAMNQNKLYPYVRVTRTQRLAMVVGINTIGLTVYEYSADDCNDGLYTYHSWGWGRTNNNTPC